MGIEFRVRTNINFDGQPYDSPDQMPADVRTMYQKAMADGGLLKVGTAMQTRIVFNGKEYASPDEMPANVRRIYDQVMGTIDRDGNGVPDLLPPQTRLQKTAAPQRIETRDRPTAFPANPQSFGPASKGSGLLWKVTVFVVAGAIAAAVLLLVFRP